MRQSCSVHWTIAAYRPRMTYTVSRGTLNPTQLNSIAAYATLSRDFVAHSRDKIAREICRCDIGLRSLTLQLHTSMQ